MKTTLIDKLVVALKKRIAEEEVISEWDPNNVTAKKRRQKNERLLNEFLWHMSETAREELNLEPTPEGEKIIIKEPLYVIRARAFREAGLL